MNKVIGFTWIVIILMINGQVYSQSSFSGYVQNESGTPLPYANIYLAGESCGTLSDENGFFSFECFVESEKKILLHIDYLGYLSEKIYTDNFTDHQVVQLQESNVELKTIEVVPSSNGQESILKYKPRKPYYYYQSNVETNYQVASRISNVDKESGFISEIKFYIGQASVNRLPIRINFYDVDAVCECPGKALHTTNIIVEVKKGQNKINLKPYNISIPNSDFYVSFEWLSVSDKRKGKLDFSIGMLPVKSNYPLLERVGGLAWRELNSSKKSRVLTTIKFIVD